MLHKRFFIPGLAIASHIIADEESREAAIIDPSRDVKPYLDYLKQQKLHLRFILETHVHADFVSGSRELKVQLKQEQKPEIGSSAEGGEEWLVRYADRNLHDNDVLKLGALRIRALHTPGHTPEHLSYLVYEEDDRETPVAMFSGDFIFVGAIGRPDLLGKEVEQHLANTLYDSVFDRVAALPDTVEVFPSHGAGSLCGKNISDAPSTTLGTERKKNESFEQKPKKEWVSELMEGMPLAPPYFTRMKQVNREGAPIVGEESIIPVIAPDAVDLKKDLVIDIRQIEEFHSEFIAGSINLPLGAAFSHWAAWLLDPNTPIYLVGNEKKDQDQNEEKKERAHTVEQLRLVGLDNIVGFIEGGVDGWKKAGRPLDSFGMLSAGELAEGVEAGLEIVDVRTPAEWNLGHIEGAKNIPLSELSTRIKEIDATKSIAVICGSGYRGSIASSLLKRWGFTQVWNVLGGMSGWQDLQLPRVIDVD